MAHEVIDGTIRGLKAKRMTRRRCSVDSVCFRVADGSDRTLRNLVVAREIAEAMAPGLTGRFYIHCVPGAKGVYGIRCRDGRAIFAFPGAARTLLAASGIAALAAVTGAILLSSPGLCALATSAIVAGPIVAGVHVRRAARRQFEHDPIPFGCVEQSRAAA